MGGGRSGGRGFGGLADGGFICIVGMVTFPELEDVGGGVAVSGVYHVDEVRSQVQLTQSGAFLGLGAGEHYTIGLCQQK